MFELLLLPALPSRWQSGSIIGLGAPCNRRVDIAWKNGEITAYTVQGNKDKLTMLYKGKEI